MASASAAQLDPVPGKRRLQRERVASLLQATASAMHSLKELGQIRAPKSHSCGQGPDVAIPVPTGAESSEPAVSRGMRVKAPHFPFHTASAFGAHLGR